MINFKEVSFKNYILFREGKIPLENQGVVFVKGVNGTGKSTAFESIQAPCFVKTSKGAKDYLVMDKNLEINISFTRNDDSYEITQYRVHEEYGNALVLKKNGKLDPNAPKGKTPLEKYIQEEVMKMSLVEYNHFVHVPQKAFNRLIFGTPGERYQFISDLFQLESYDTVLKELDERHNKIINQLVEYVEIEIRLKQLKEQLTSYPKQKELVAVCEMHKKLMNEGTEYKDNLYQELTKAKEYQNISEVIGRCEDKFLIYKNQISEIDIEHKYDLSPVSFGDKEATLYNLDKIGKLLSGYNSNIREIALSLYKLQERNNIIEQLKKNKVAYTKQEIVNSINKNKAIINDQIRLREDAEKLEMLKEELLKYGNIKESFESLNDENDEITKALSYAINDLDNVEKGLKNIIDLKGAEKCDKCGALLDPKKTQQAIHNYNKKKLELTQEVKELTKQAMAIRERKTYAYKKDQIKNSIKNMGKIILLNEKDINQVKDECFLMEDEYEKYIRYEKLKTELENIPDSLEDKAILQEKSKNINIAIETLSLCKRAFESMKNTFDLIPYTDKGYDKNIDFTTQANNLEKIYNEVINAFIEASTEVNLYEKRLDNLVQLKREITNIKNILKEKKELNIKDKIYKVLKKAYGKYGLKLNKIRKIIKAVHMVLPKYTNLLFQDLTFTTSDDQDNIHFVARQKNSKGKIREYDARGISGGEECRLIVCLVLTFNEINNSDKRSNILILDEIDHYLDEEGIAAFYTEIIPIARELYQSIFIISHAPELFGRNYDKSIALEKKDGISYLN